MIKRPTVEDIKMLQSLAPPAPRVAFMTQQTATKLVEAMEAGRGAPWLAGLEIRPVPLGSRIFSTDGRWGIIRDVGSIELGPKDAIVIPPEIAS